MNRTIYSVMLIALFLFAMPAHSMAGTFPPLPEAVAAMASDSAVTVTKVEIAAWSLTPDWGSDNYTYVFEPVGKSPETGFIFYPGAFVDVRAYAPYLREFAKAGYLAIVVKMPNDTAFASMDRAKEVIANYPAIKKWVISGHSMGGIAASAFIRDNIDKKFTNKMAGVVLWAAYGDPTAFCNIADATVKGLVIHGSNDGLSTPAKVEAGKPYLPQGTTYVEIQGGNHTQFGWYDTSPDPVQPGDNAADITRAEQQQQIVAATLDFLNTIAKEGCPVITALGESDPGVTTARMFRDSVLSKSAAGRTLIDMYYKNSADMAALLEGNPVLKQSVRSVLQSLLPLLQIMLPTGA